MPRAIFPSDRAGSFCSLCGHPIEIGQMITGYSAVTPTDGKYRKWAHNDPCVLKEKEIVRKMSAILQTSHPYRVMKSYGIPEIEFRKFVAAGQYDEAEEMFLVAQKRVPNAEPVKSEYSAPPARVQTATYILADAELNPVMDSGKPKIRTMSQKEADDLNDMFKSTNTAYRWLVPQKEAVAS